MEDLRAGLYWVDSPLAAVVTSIEALLEVQKQLQDRGLSLAVRDDPTPQEENFWPHLLWVRSFRSKVSQIRTEKQIAVGRAEGKRSVGRPPPCVRCRHGVQSREGNGTGHVRLEFAEQRYPLAIGKCFRVRKDGTVCGCDDYAPWNTTLMGKPSRGD